MQLLRLIRDRIPPPVKTAILIGVIVGGLFAINEGLSRAVQIYSSTATDDLPKLSFLVRFFGNQYNLQIIILIGVNIILAVSLNLINGITGQFSIGHAGFMAIGAYSSAAFSKFVGPRIASSLHLSPIGEANVVLPIVLLLSALAAAVSGLIVGVPSLRLRGDYLAIVTLGFGEIIIVLIVNIPAIGGARGFPDVPPYTNFFWVYLMAVLTIVIVRNLVQSSHGRALMAVRDDEIAAEAVGINTTAYKVMAFVIGSSFAGVAGTLQGHYIQSVHPGSFTFLKSVEVLVMIVLGGLGSLTGSIFTAAALTVLQETLREIPGVMAASFLLAGVGLWLSYPRFRGRTALYVVRVLGVMLALGVLFYFGRGWLEDRKQSLRMVVYSVMLIVLMLQRPQGLLGRKELGVETFRRLFRRRQGGLLASGC